MIASPNSTEEQRTKAMEIIAMAAPAFNDGPFGFFDFLLASKFACDFKVNNELFTIEDWNDCMNFVNAVRESGEATKQ